MNEIQKAKVEALKQLVESAMLVAVCRYNPVKSILELILDRVKDLENEQDNI